LNQLITHNASGEDGKMRFTGTTTDEAWVTVAGVAAKKLPGNRFEAWVNMKQGENTIPIAAMTPDKVIHTENYKVNVPATTPQTLTYDADGNLASDGRRTFEWDAHNRLAKINHSDGSTTEYTYDAMGRRTRIIIWNASGTLASERRFLWIPGGNQPYEERTASNAATARYFAQGEQRFWVSPNDKFFYTRDHLGSVRELVNNGGTVQATYDYDPYGRRTKVSGAWDTVVGYTGHHWQERSRLYLTWYRQYDPNLGRWLSRDPIGEGGGMNLYGYVLNNPINFYDPDGLFLQDWFYNTDFSPVLDPITNFSAGWGDGLSFGLTDWAREKMGNNDSVNKCSSSYTAGEWTGFANGSALGGAGLLRGGAQIAIANRGNAVGKWLSQGRYIRLGASGAKQTPTLRIGAARPVTRFNHIDLTFCGF